MSEQHYLDLCAVCGFTRGNHRWHGQNCPGGKRVRWGFSAWRASRFHGRVSPPGRGLRRAPP